MNLPRARAACVLLCTLVMYQLPGMASFTAFESGQVRPLALSSAGDRLFAVNTPDNHLEIFSVTATGLTLQASVAVGLEPVAVAVRSAGEVWVVNHLSDSISIVDVAANPPRVTRTLLVGDEPRDIVFAGNNGAKRAFITTAHRGQNSPYTNPNNPGELTTPGIGRADVWVFNAADPGSGLGGTPLTIVTLFGDTPRPLAVSPDGSTVYAGIYHSGNLTTTIAEGAVCDGGAAASPCNATDATSPGGLPAPNMDAANAPQPEAGLIVRQNALGDWVDELGRSWNNQVRFNLPDKDVFAIDATADPPVETAAWSGVGTILSDIAVHPLTGKLFVANTEAINEVRFEGTRAANDTTSTVLGHLHETRITVIDTGSGTVTPRHLNKHIDYSLSPAPSGVANRSLALPRQLVFSGDGSTLYLAAKGSDKVGIFSSSQIENNTFVPDSADHIPVSGGGPAGLLLDAARNRLYVTTRFDNGLSIIDLTSRNEDRHYLLHNPEPPDLVAGRRFLYDARLTSSNGEAACASCHVDGDLDSLAWDLGNPDDVILNNPLDFALGPFNNPPQVYKDFHPLKGPMTTQTLRGMAGHGSMHWRGDRTGGNDPGGDPLDEDAAFKKFNSAFAALLGRSGPLSVPEMQAYTDFILQLLPPPNPVRALDDGLTAMQTAGQTFYFNAIVDTQTCNGCHVLDAAQGFFGTDGRASFEGEPQHMKIPQLRNMYSKVGMFGMPAVPFFNSGNNAHQGDQIRGFGFLHDGSTDTLLRFLDATLFNFPGGDPQRREVEQFLFAMDSNLKPVVGQQITLTHSNKATADPRVDLLIARALAGDADLVVKGTINGVSRGWRRLSNGTFESDRVAEPPLTEAGLRNLAQTAGQALTFMAVPPGSGIRSGIDRDGDSLLDGDDNCPAAANTGQQDNDADAQGDACDPDDDNDGVDDVNDAFPLDPTESVDTDGDGTGNNADGDDDNDGLADTLDPLPLVFNYSDGDVAPRGSPDGQLNAADYLILIRVLHGQVVADDELLAHGDLYPAGAPDGILDLSDLILLQQLVLP